MRAVVLGGGMAGLAAAWGLRRAGARVVLFDDAPSPGGRAAGFRDRGYSFDPFPRPLAADDAEIARLCEAWSGQPLPRQRIATRFLVDGRFLRFPLDPRDLFGPQGLTVAAAALAGPLQRRLGRRPAPVPDFRTAMIARAGAALFEGCFGPYVEKLTGVAAADLSGDLTRRFLPPGGLLRSFVRRAFGGDDEAVEMIYPEHGLMAIPEGLARALQRAGVEILARHRVMRLAVGGAGISEVAAEGPSGIVRCAPDLVVSTLPITALLEALDGIDVAGGRAALQGLRFRSAVQVFLGVRRDRLTADHTLYVPDGTVRFHRLSEMVNFAPRMAPRGATGLCAEIACDADDAVWSEGDAGQVRRAIDDLCFLGFLRSTSEVEAAWVRRDRDAEPVETQGHGEAVRAIDLLLAGIPNLQRCGAQGIFPDPGAVAALRAGLETAAAAAAASPARAA